MCIVFPADLGNMANINKSKLLHPLILYLKMLSGGEKKSLSSWKVYEGFTSETKMSKGAHSSLFRSQTSHLFSSRLAATESHGFPCEKSSLSPRNSSAPNISMSLTWGGRKEKTKQNKTKQLSTLKVGFMSSLQMLIHPKPTKCLRSSRKPKP